MGYTRRGTQLRLLSLVVPAGGLFAAGAAATVLQSFGLLVPVPNPVPGGGAWANLFTDRWIWHSALHSLAVAGASAGMSVALGTLLAWGVHRLPGRWRQAAAVYKIPLVLPHLTIAYIAILIFGQSGIISSAAAGVGLVNTPSDFPNLLYSGHGIGVGLAYVMKETSFVMLMAIGGLRKLDENLLISARMLGASRLAVFRDIVVPHLRPVLISSFVILTLYAMGAFEIPWLIGESRPQMLSITAYNLYFHRDLARRPEAAALLTLLLIISAGLIAGVFPAGRRRRKRRSRPSRYWRYPRVGAVPAGFPAPGASADSADSVGRADDAAPADPADPEYPSAARREEDQQ